MNIQNNMLELKVKDYPINIKFINMELETDCNGSYFEIEIKPNCILTFDTNVNDEDIFNKYLILEELYETNIYRIEMEDMLDVLKANKVANAEIQAHLNELVAVNSELVKIISKYNISFETSNKLNRSNYKFIY